MPSTSTGKRNEKKERLEGLRSKLDALLTAMDTMSLRNFKKEAMAAWSRVYPNGIPVINRAPNKWALFVRSNYADIKRSLGANGSHSSVMKRLGELYRQEVEMEEVPIVAKPTWQEFVQANYAIVAAEVGGSRPVVIKALSARYKAQYTTAAAGSKRKLIE